MVYVISKLRVTKFIMTEQKWKKDWNYCKVLEDGNIQITDALSIDSYEYAIRFFKCIKDWLKETTKDTKIRMRLDDTPRRTLYEYTNALLYVDDLKESRLVAFTICLFGNDHVDIVIIPEHPQDEQCMNVIYDMAKFIKTQFSPKEVILITEYEK